MFKCDRCRVSSLKPRKIVTERKTVTHATAPNGPRGSVGSQIVKEILVCDSCASSVVEAPIVRNVAEHARKPSEATMALAASVQEYVA